MKTAWLGLVTAVLLLASAAAHGLLGWPSLLTALSTSSVEPDVTAALAAGWLFGSACMLSFSFIVGVQALRHMKGLAVDSACLWGIAGMYVLFGASAFVLRHFNPHFLLFVLTGILIAAFAWLCAAARAPSAGSN